MSFLKKIKKNEMPSEKDIEIFLMQFHDRLPAITEKTWGTIKTKEDKTTYEVLLDSVEFSTLPTKGIRTIVDLACGSGPLIECIIKKFGQTVNIIGVDLNAEELKAARKKCNYPNVTFLQESAQSLSIKSQSVDVVFCHMAFMLFRPLEPVLVEIARILKPSCVFAAVVNTLGDPPPLFLKVTQTMMEMLCKKYPQFKGFRWGDQRLIKPESLQTLFSKSLGFEEKIQILNYELLIKEKPGALAQKLLDFYYYTDFFSKKEKLELISKWTQLFQDTCAPNKIMILTLPLTAFLVRKL